MWNLESADISASKFEGCVRHAEFDNFRMQNAVLETPIPPLPTYLVIMIFKHVKY